jgi:hypothetical protein
MQHSHHRTSAIPLRIPAIRPHALLRGFAAACALLFAAGPGRAQGVWHHAIDKGVTQPFNNNVTVDHAGNVIVAAQSNIVPGASGPQLLLEKYDAAGHLLWERTHSGRGTLTEPLYSAVDSHDNIYIVGTHDVKGLIVTKYTPDGVFVAQKTISNNGFNGASTFASPYGSLPLYPYEWVVKAGVSPDDALYVCGMYNFIDYSISNGSVTAFTNGILSTFVTKIDSDLSPQWTKPFGDANRSGNGLWALTFDHAGNVVVAGSFLTGGTVLDGLVTGPVLVYPAGSSAAFEKFDPSGNILATASLGSALGYQWSGATDAAVDHEDNVYLTGSYFSQATGNSVLLTDKFDGSGNLAWQRAFTGPGSAEAEGQKIAVDSHDHVIVAGTSNAVNDRLADGIRTLLAYDSDGNRLWTDRSGYHDQKFAQVSSLLIDASDNIYAVTDYIHTNSLHSPHIEDTTKFAPSGATLWTQRYDVATQVTGLTVPQGAALNPSNGTIDTLTRYSTNGIETGDEIWVLIAY